MRWRRRRWVAGCAAAQQHVLSPARVGSCKSVVAGGVGAGAATRLTTPAPRLSAAQLPRSCRCLCCCCRPCGSTHTHRPLAPAHLPTCAQINDKDAEVLSYCTDVRCEQFHSEGEEEGDEVRLGWEAPSGHVGVWRAALQNSTRGSAAQHAVAPATSHSIGQRSAALRSMCRAAAHCAIMHRPCCPPHPATPCRPRSIACALRASASCSASGTTPTSPTIS